MVTFIRENKSSGTFLIDSFITLDYILVKSSVPWKILQQLRLHREDPGVVRIINTKIYHIWEKCAYKIVKNKMLSADYLLDMFSMQIVQHFGH